MTSIPVFRQMVWRKGTESASKPGLLILLILRPPEGIVPEMSMYSYCVGSKSPFSPRLFTVSPFHILPVYGWEISCHYHRY